MLEQKVEKLSLSNELGLVSVNFSELILSVTPCKQGHLSFFGFLYYVRCIGVYHFSNRRVKTELAFLSSSPKHHFRSAVASHLAFPSTVPMFRCVVLDPLFKMKLKINFEWTFNLMDLDRDKT